MNDPEVEDVKVLNEQEKRASVLLNVASFNVSRAHGSIWGRNDLDPVQVLEWAIVQIQDAIDVLEVKK